MIVSLLIDSNRRTGIDRAERKKSIVNRSIDEIELRLKPIEKFVQTARNDLPGIRVSELSARCPSRCSS
jgi:hypothetical protein